MMIKGTGFNVNLFSNSGIRPIIEENDSIRTEAAGMRAGSTFRSEMRERTDSIEISSGKADSSRAVLEKTKDQIMHDINRDTGADELKNLKDRIASGKYTVNPDELAEILAR